MSDFEIVTDNELIEKIARTQKIARSKWGLRALEVGQIAKINFVKEEGVNAAQIYVANRACQLKRKFKTSWLDGAFYVQRTE